ncbi:MAG TPA: VWA domain-containing protein [Terriglobales bacterium]|jgi:Mg-chelatase subunit ChlD
MMRISSTLMALAALVGSLNGQTANTPAIPISAGPVYTRGSEAGAYPQYPDLQIQVEIPPDTNRALVKSEAFIVKAENGSSAYATRLQSLASTRYGMAVSVAIDVSGSMKGAPLNAVRSGLSKFVADAETQDKIAIQTIADDGRWEAGWEQSRDEVRAALDKLQARGSLTRLWDGLLDAIQHFPTSPLSQRIIVISDGHDEGSSHTEEEVIAAAKQHGILIDAVGITRSNPVYLQGLAKLASQTGGQFREARNNDELDKLVGSGIQRLKATPVVSFRLEDLPADGASHHLQVIWHHEGAESQADITVTLPPAPPWYMRHWVWGVGGGTLVLILVLAIALGKRRQPEKKLYTGMPPLEQVSPKPAPTPAPVVVPQPVPIGGSVLEPLSTPRKVAATPYEAARPVRVKTQIIARFPAPSKENPTAFLLCEKGFAPGQKFPVNTTEYWIGALENNHLHIADDPTVSGNHACLIFEHDVLGIYDYKSTNGTRVNGEVVKEKRHLLRPGDRIQIGRSTFAIQLAEQERV